MPAKTIVTSTLVRVGNGLRQRFTSRQQALQYAQNDKLRNRMAADMKATQTDSFDYKSNIHVDFTSNHEDYMAVSSNM